MKPSHQFRLILVQLIIGTATSQVFLYNTISQCKPTDFFDVEHLKCRPCDSAIGLKPAENRLSCICDPNNSTSTVDYDNLSRLPVCDVRNKTITTESFNRTCSMRTIKLTTSGTVQHVQILPTYPDNSSICAAVCPAKSHQLATFRGQSFCISQALLNDFAAFRTFTPATPAASSVFVDLPTLAFFCRTMRDPRACNHLANLCILHRYQHTPRHSPCSLFGANLLVPPAGQLKALTKISAVDRPADDDDDYDTKRNVRYPTLFVAAPGKDTVDLLDTQLGQRYTLNEDDDQRLLQLLQVRYDLRGNLQVMQPLSVDDLNPCVTTTAADSNLARSIRFGRSAKTSCAVNVVRMIQHFQRNGEFVELYLNYTEEKLNLMRKIPVLIEENDDLQSQSARDKWQLVNRFVTIDTHTDPNAKYQPTNLFFTLDNLQQFKSIRYANRIELQIRIDSDHKARPNRILVPVLVVGYAVLNTTDILTTDAGAFVDFTFTVTFSKQSNVGRVLEILLYTFGALAVLNGLLETFRYKIRQQRQFCDGDIFVRCVGYVCGNVASALLWSVLSVAVYTAVVHRDDETVRLVLPMRRELRLMQMLVYVSVPVKVLLVLHHLWRLCSVDVFFVDWERPRSFDSHMKTHLTDTPSISSVQGQNLMYEGVSAWRTYFVANQWLKLSTTRPFSIRLQVVLVGIVVVILKQCSASHKEPDPIITLAYTASTYLIAYVTQRLLNWMCCQQIGGPSLPQRFVNVCSMANVSVFVLHLETFGYYVHGRSPHGFADTDATSMLMQLRRERDQTLGHRGLLLNAEQQTYAVMLPPNFRMLYDRLVAPLRSVIQTGSGSKFFASNMEKTAAAYYHINRFLSAFIDHGLKDMDYVIQDKTLLQRLFDVEQLDDCNETRGVFYSDAGHSFDGVMLYGNELQLFQIELMLFVLVVCLSGNAMLALTVVVSAHMFIRWTIGWLMKRNLSRKTIIEPAFLQ